MKSTARLIAAILVASTVASMATTPPKHIMISLNGNHSAFPYAINDRAVSSEKLNELLGRLALLDTNQPIIIEVFSNTSVEMWLEMNDRVKSCGFASIRSVYQGSNFVAEIKSGNTTNGTLEQLLWPGLENRL